jgi:hypothetical protein
VNANHIICVDITHSRITTHKDATLAAVLNTKVTFHPVTFPSGNSPSIIHGFDISDQEMINTINRLDIHSTPTRILYAVLRVLSPLNLPAI